MKQGSKMKKITKSKEPVVTEWQVREVVETMLRDAFQTHSRDLEKQLRDINSRLTTLEKPRK